MAAFGSIELHAEGRVPRILLIALLTTVLLAALAGSLSTFMLRGARAQGAQGQNVTFITGPTNITKPGYYVLSSNLTGAQSIGYCIGIFASDVVLYGDGHGLAGDGWGVGIYVASGSSNVSIEDVDVTSYSAGIVVNTSGVRVVSSSVSDNFYDIIMAGPNDTVLSSSVSGGLVGVIMAGPNDTVLSSSVSGGGFGNVGVYVTGSDDSLVNSTVRSELYGVYVNGSDDRFVRNHFVGDGIVLLGPYYEIVANDTVNGRPLVYLYNATGITVRFAGQVIAVDSRGIRVISVNVSYASAGVQFWEVNDSMIEDVVASSNSLYGVYVNGYNDSVVNSNVRSDWIGVVINGNDNAIVHSILSRDWFGGVSVLGSDNSILNSTLSENHYGIYLHDDSGTLITGDVITNNGACGLYMDGSRGDLIYNNLFNNTRNVCIVSGFAYWNVSLRPGRNIVGGDMIGGNAWLTPNGTGFSQVTPALPNDPYICDEPYVISGNNTDYLPLKYPFSNNSTTTTTTATTTTTTTTTTTSTSTTTTTTSTMTTTSTTTSTPSTTTTSATATASTTTSVTTTATQTVSTPTVSTTAVTKTTSAVTTKATTTPTSATTTASARKSLPFIALVAAVVVVVVAAAAAVLLRGRR